MGFFSKLFTTVFQPVNAVVNTATHIVNGATAGVDTVVNTVATAVAPIPVVGTVLAEASFQVNNATDLADHAMGAGQNIVADSGVLAGGTLDLNADDFNFALDDIVHYQALGTVDFALSTTASQAVSSVFDFG